MGDSLALLHIGLEDVFGPIRFYTAWTALKHALVPRRALPCSAELGRRLLGAVL